MRIVFVGSGNICRSAAAERLTLSYLDAALGSLGQQISVTSAGTDPVLGSAMHPVTRAGLRDLRASGRAFRTQRLSAELLAGADLVLTATTELRDAVLDLHPAGSRTTFTMREAAELLVQLPAIAAPLARTGDRHAARVIALLADTRTRRWALPGEDDVLDPQGHDDRVHQQVVGEIAVALQPLLHALVLPEYAAQLWSSAPASPVEECSAVA